MALVFILPDGSMADKISEEQLDILGQKVLDEITPLLYEYEMKLLAEEA